MSTGVSRAACLLSLVVLVSSCTAAPAPPPPAAPPPAAPQFINLVEPWPYPFSSAVRTGNLLFVSGQIGTRIVDGKPVLVAGGLEPETRQTLDNIRQIVERGGSTMARVVKCMVMLADMRDWPKVNEIYATYFPGPKPARSAFGATGLALNARVEIECIADVAGR
jgi:2-iminobutanoate/2-iminopropanoate deaminase